MGNHHSLGSARRAGRINDISEMIASRAGRQVVDGLVIDQSRVGIKANELRLMTLNPIEQARLGDENRHAGIAEHESNARRWEARIKRYVRRRPL